MSMSVFARYFLAQEHTARAKAEREAASHGLYLARVHERMAEVQSQSNPLADRICPHVRDRYQYGAERRRHLETVFYVVVGRWPREDEIE